MELCAESHGHTKAVCLSGCDKTAPLLPGFMAADASAPVRFPETAACLAAAVAAVHAFQTMLVLADTTYGWTFGIDETDLGKRFMAVCSPGDTARACAGKIVLFFRTELHSDMWPVGLDIKHTEAHQKS